MLENSNRVLYLRDGQVEKIQTRAELDIQEGEISVGDERLH